MLRTLRALCRGRSTTLGAVGVEGCASAPDSWTCVTLVCARSIPPIFALLSLYLPHDASRALQRALLGPVALEKGNSTLIAPHGSAHLPHRETASFAKTGTTNGADVL